MAKRKIGAAAVQEAAIGGNSDEALRGYIDRHAKFEQQIVALRGKQKINLQEAKDAGFLKMAIRSTVKCLSMTDEQRQTKDEVAAERERYTQLCRGLPLFQTLEEAA